jgi:hypothetical protein
MAYEDDDYGYGTGSEGSSSQTNYGLASNPLMPMGDPIAYARMMQNPTGNAPVMANTLMPIETPAGMHTPGMQVPQMARLAPLNVPDMGGGRGGGGSPEGQQPTEQAPTDMGPNLNSMQGLLQLKGLESLAGPQGPATTLTPGGAVARPGAGAGPGRSPTGVSIAAAAAPYQDMVNDAAKQNGVNPQTLTRLLYRESQFDPKAKSPAGAQGIGQFMPATAKEEGVDVNDPKSSIYGSAKYLAKMTKLFNGNEQLGMAAYNWGPGNVHNWLKTGGLQGGVGLSGKPMPGETTDYVNAISGRPLAPNVKAANVPSAAAAPMAALIAGQGGGFAVPGGGQNQREQQIAPAPEFGRSPKAGQMSPHGGPYITGADGGIYATDGDGKVVGPAVKGITTPAPETETAKPSSVSPGDENPVYQGTPNLGGGVSRPQMDPNKIVPGATAPTETKPTQDQPQQQQPSGQSPALQGFGQDPRLQKLWQYMLIKSLMPEIKFRNIGYDPWAVHRFGQGGGY